MSGENQELQMKRAEIELVLADYHCGCSWVGERGKCSETCEKHGDSRRTIIKLPDNSDLSQGWSCL